MWGKDVQKFFVVVVLLTGTASFAVAQEPSTQTRDQAIEQAQADKVKDLHSYAPGKVEALFNRAEEILVNRAPSWHPYFESADYGGGFTLGAGYAHHVSPYNMLDVRGSYTILGYNAPKRSSPRLVCFIGAGPCRCLAAGAKRRSRRSTASAWIRHSMIAQTSRFGSRMDRPPSRCGPRAAC